MVYPVFDILHILVGLRHTDVLELVDQFVLWVLSAVFDSLINRIQLLPKRLFGLFAVNICKLLQLKLVFSHKVLLFLSQVTQVPAWCASKDLT